MTIDEIKDILITDADYSESKVENMDGWDLINAWLNYEGIIGYTTDVITAVLSVHKAKNLSDWEEF